MHSLHLTLNSPIFTPTTLTKTPKSKTISSPSSLVCKASSSSSSITSFDLYDLLGIESCSDQSEIKQAYRGLQKKCHPDIAGAAGHDMAIILNEAYAVLSDPLSRFSYDKEQAKVAEFKGYTGKPIYSVWYGSEKEQRAVFVDEVKCVGCLKCALFAEKTFAVESVYGRARVVAQWADPEHKIREAIEACPVDCISMVERSKLAALEFLMSKQPRGHVRVGAGNTVAARVSNIFVDVDKFQSKFLEQMEKVSSKHSKESDHQWEVTMSAILAIRSITNWLYWQPPIPGMPSSPTSRKLIQIPQNSTQSESSPNVEKIRDAANARKQARETTKHEPSGLSDEYWTPALILPESTNSPSNKKLQTPSSSNKKLPKGASNKNAVNSDIDSPSDSPYEIGIPAGMAIVAGIVVRFKLADHAGGGIEGHVGGSLLQDVVNSSWLQVILAGVTWYLIGMAGVELANIFKIKLGHDE